MAGWAIHNLAGERSTHEGTDHSLNSDLPQNENDQVTKERVAVFRRRP
jgi:hypothetical protein